MDFEYFGANCVRVSNKKVSVVIDDNLSAHGLKSITTKNDISIFTLDKNNTNESKFTVEGPGEYEIAEVSIRGIPARAHIDEDGLRATIYNVIINGFSVGVLGHVYSSLSDEQLEQLGVIDILIVPVGGNGYTIDAAGAANLVKQIEPKVVLPTHYADNGVSYEVPQAELGLFLTAMGASDSEHVDVLKLKEADLGDKTRVVVLNRSK